MSAALKTLVSLCLAFTLTSCTSVPMQAAPETPSPRATTADNPASSPQPPAVRQVTTSWEPGTFQNGIQLYWHFPGTDTDVEAKAASMLDYIVSLGANSVGISFPIYTDGSKPTRVYAEKDTPTPQQLSLVIAAAKERGLRIMVRPIMNEANIVAQDPLGWRGSIMPRNVDAWFASYEQLLIRYAITSSQGDVQEFVAGTELTSLRGYTKKWQKLIGQLATKFDGIISYSTNWNEQRNPAFRMQGVDAYPVVNLNDNATSDQLTAALTKWLRQNPLNVRNRLTLQEVGIPARGGVYRHPWHWGMNTAPLNFLVQANWFDAMCQSAHATSVIGIYYWAVDTNVDLKHMNPLTDYSGSFVGRPAEQSIKTCFIIPSK